MKLSIIVPVYNMARDNKLNFCLDSLINQTLSDYEIIAVNDASTDNSLDILREYEAKYPGFFKVITYERNRHQGGARNEGLKIAKGEWIGFIDSDDWVSKDYYETLIKRGEETGADMVGSNFTLAHEHSFKVGKVIDSNTLEQTGVMDVEKRKKLIVNSGSLVMKIYRRSMIFDNNLYFPEDMFYEDNAVGSVWMLYSKHFELVSGPLYYYYMHDDSTVHVVTQNKCEDRIKAMEILVSEMKKRGFFETYKEEIESIFIRLYLVNTLFGYMIDGKNKNYAFVKRIKKGMIETFPDFRSNKDYASIPDAEQKRMIDLFMKNSFAFYVYYNLLWTYRRLRKRFS